MLKGKEVLLRHIADINPVITSHGVGEKRVIVTQAEVGKPYTQLARTVLHRGDHVERHSHPSMEEHFFFLEGECDVMIEDSCYSCKGGDYLFVPAAHSHEIEVVGDTIMITIGIETCLENILD